MSIPDRHPALLHADQGKVVRARGDLYVFKALAAQTEGHYSLFDCRHRPGGGVPLHRHQQDEEGMFVLQGRYRFRVGDQQLELGPGDFLHVPRPTPHAFEALEPSRMLVIVAPGGFHERYFEEAWETIDDLHNPPPPREPDMRRVLDALHRAGMEMLPADGAHARPPAPPAPPAEPSC
jgi:quercetin dioxygenase-like cupin family protein